MAPETVTEPRRKWRHRAGDMYVLLTASAVGNEQVGFRIEHYRAPGYFPSVATAKRAGLRTLGRADDFNIGAVRHGHLEAILWMDEVVDDDPVVLLEIGEEVSLYSRRG